MFPIFEKPVKTAGISLSENRKNTLSSTSTSFSSAASILTEFEAAIQADNITNAQHLAYLDRLKTNEQQMRAYLIARHQLETSFDIERSNGFQEFLNLKKN